MLGTERAVLLGVLLDESPTTLVRTNHDGQTILHLAIENAMYEVVEWLVTTYRSVLHVPAAWIVDVLHTKTDDAGQTIREQAMDDGEEPAFLRWLDEWLAVHGGRKGHS